MMPDATQRVNHAEEVLRRLAATPQRTTPLSAKVTAAVDRAENAVREAGQQQQ